MAGVDITEVQDGVVLVVKVVPGASRTAISGELDGMLKIKVSAPPEKGRANQCLIEFLSKRLRVKKKAVSILSGTSHPAKRVQISGVTAEEVMGELLPSGK
ncbi:MAG TPA: YggU family protein [Planctomycetes bacterium]|nr:YggU family protein [Planctomycetota bacterium]